MILKYKLAGLCAFIWATSVFAITPIEYKEVRQRIDTEHNSAQMHCNTLVGNARAVCKKEAKARAKVAEAELLYQANASDQHKHNLAKVKENTSYNVAREKCNGLKGNAKDICIKDVKVAHVKAVEAMRVEDALKEENVTSDKKSVDILYAKIHEKRNVRKAEYQAACARCNSYAGDIRGKCIADAKRLYCQ